MAAVQISKTWTLYCSCCVVTLCIWMAMSSHFFLQLPVKHKRHSSNIETGPQLFLHESWRGCSCTTTLSWITGRKPMDGERWCTPRWSAEAGWIVPFRLGLNEFRTSWVPEDLLSRWGSLLSFSRPVDTQQKQFTVFGRFEYFLRGDVCFHQHFLCLWSPWTL